jgi:hypothetical protein
MSEPVENLILLIDKALNDLQVVVSETPTWTYDKDPVKRTFALLTRLKKDARGGLSKIDEKVLRATHNLGVSSFKDFENTPLEDSILEVTAFLRRNIPKYNGLKLLDWNFGKEDW